MGQVKNFMAELDEWAERSIIDPLADAYTHGPEEVIVSAKGYAKRAIREKVLESYHNGQTSPQKRFQRPIQARQ